jgi:hypothetical protein
MEALCVLDHLAARGNVLATLGKEVQIFCFEGSDKRVAQEDSRYSAEHTVVIEGNRLAWLKGQTLHKIFTLPARIVKVVLCSFGAKAREFCVLHDSGLSVYPLDGGVHRVALPCKIDDIWALESKLLLKRAISANDSGSDPVLFTLAHPLEELKPLTSFLGSGDAPSAFWCDTRKKVVWSSSELPLMVLYDTDSKKHSFWKLSELPPPTRTYTETQNQAAQQYHERTQDLTSFLEGDDTIRWEDHSIHAQISIEEVFEDEPCAAAALSVGLVADSQLAPMLCMLVESNELRLYHMHGALRGSKDYPRIHFTRAGALQARSWCAIPRSGRKKRHAFDLDMLVLALDGTVALYRGLEALSNVRVPVLNKQPVAVNALANPVGENLTVIGDVALRCR